MVFSSHVLMAVLSVELEVRLIHFDLHFQQRNLYLLLAGDSVSCAESYNVTAGSANARFHLGCSGRRRSARPVRFIIRCLRSRLVILRDGEACQAYKFLAVEQQRFKGPGQLAL
jgi:hypothetical protein